MTADLNTLLTALHVELTDRIIPYREPGRPANPKPHGQRDQARQTLERQPANRPAPGTAASTDKSLPGQGTEEFSADLEGTRRVGHRRA